ncbi:isoprenoid synthase domain-containing protein [Truncatella angustata]|uniref:Terpene synthase n=1 Tax=Truncatella angustata TaxID=152316 RepID=A0A9P8UKY1_9PEZI|nr:isoprenoid synthase domain-containing protein [Truncatella angustata]KAH6654009.1 isoprenoid synthase domain-containing protein [Truncatella angustata]
MEQLSAREGILEALDGREFRIADLSALFSNWPQTVSPCLDELRGLIPEILMSLTTSSEKLFKLNKADFALFATSWWPDAPLGRAHILACLVVWVRSLRSNRREIDAEVGTMARDLKGAQEFRDETTEFMRQYLGLCEPKVKTPRSRIIAFFKVIGDAACETYSLGHRKLLFSELEFFMKTSELEQRRRLRVDLPTLDEYVSCRMGTSACNVTTFFNEFSIGVTIPAHILTSPSMRRLWDATNTIIWAVNDLLSLKKEVAQQTVDSLLPLLFYQYGDLERSAQTAIDLIAANVAEFDMVAERLLERWRTDDIADSLRLYIDACRYNCTGNLHWSLRTGRYGIHQEAISKGIIVRLESKI